MVRHEMAVVVLCLAALSGCSTPQTIKDLSQAQLTAFHLHERAEQALLESLLEQAQQNVSNLVKAKQAELERRRDAAKAEFVRGLLQEIPPRVTEILEQTQEKARAKILEGNRESFVFEKALQNFIQSESLPPGVAFSVDGLTVGGDVVSPEEVFAYIARRLRVLENTVKAYKTYPQRLESGLDLSMKRIDARYDVAAKRLADIRAETDEGIRDLRIAINALADHYQTMKNNQQFFDEYFNRISGLAIVMGRALSSLGVPVRPETLNKLVVLGEVKASDFVAERILKVGKQQENRTETVLREFHEDLKADLRTALEAKVDTLIR